MRRILVTAISGEIGNDILRILQSNEDRLFGCDIFSTAVGMDRVEKFWQCKLGAEEGYVDELLDRCLENEITHLIVTNEREIEAVNTQRQRFTEAGIKLVMQDKELLDICLDKYETARFLESRGILVPKTYASVDEIAVGDIVGAANPYDTDKDVNCHPVGRYIVKGRKSNGSRDIFVFNNRAEYDEYMTDHKGEVVIQQFIYGDEYTVGLFGHQGSYNTICFKRQLKNGRSNVVELENDPALKEVALQVAEAFSLEGYINIQLRKYNGKYYIFEINPRISGTVGFRHEMNFDDVNWWLDKVDDKYIFSEYVCPFKKALGVRELVSKFIVKE